MPHPQHLFTGTAPALVTPFTAEGDIDDAAFRQLIDDQVEGGAPGNGAGAGVDGLVVLGTTGENPTVTHEERRRLVDAAIEQAAGRVPVVVGTGTNDTRQSVQFSREAAAAGADGLLVVGPYYNKPSQRGFRAHVAAIADATDCPIIVYNVPGRTSFNITAETMLCVAEEVPSVVGVKEASGDLAQVSDILAHRPARLAVYAGDDEIALPLVLLGGDGVVSVLCNALPGRFCDMMQAALGGEAEKARRLHFELLPAMRACFFATNPLPVKTVLAAAGHMTERVRLPLVPIGDDATRRRILSAFAAFTDGTAESAR